MKLLVSIAAAGATAETVKVIPPLTGPVIDQAGLLDASDQDRLAGLARATRAEHGGQGVQLQFFIVPSLDGETIEDLSMRAAEQWRVGSRGQDNGLLFVVARDEHRMRIEVGGGLEGGLTDAQSGRIIRNRITPAFRERRYGEGLYLGAVEALAAVGALPKDVRDRVGETGPGPRTGFGNGLCFLAILGIWLFLTLMGGAGRRRRSAWWLGPALGSSFWSGGGGSRGGGGGGWGGGGGGFSGGGASGSW